MLFGSMKTVAIHPIIQLVSLPLYAFSSTLMAKDRHFGPSNRVFLILRWTLEAIKIPLLYLITDGLYYQLKFIT